MGDRFVVDVREADPTMLWLASAKPGTHVPVAEIRSGAYRPPPVTTTSIAIEGEPVEFRLFAVNHRWIAQGTWRGFKVELEGSTIEPSQVELQLANEVPPK